jgi:hypothetical protein
VSEVRINKYFHDENGAAAYLDREDSLTLDIYVGVVSQNVRYSPETALAIARTASRHWWSEYDRRKAMK